MASVFAPYETAGNNWDPLQQQFNLTRREWEVLQLIWLSHTNQQMADKLFLLVYTIETHRKNSMQKLGVSNPDALLKFIMQHAR